MTTEYYVYAYFDPTVSGTFFGYEYEPFYIGMGKRYRMNAHLTEMINGKTPKTLKHHKICKLLKLGLKPIIIKLHENLTREEAASKEKELIRSLGTIIFISEEIKFPGPLTNLSEGGIYSKSYTPWSEERKISASNRMKERWKNDDGTMMKQALSQSSKNLNHMNDPAIIEKRLNAISTESSKRKRSESAKRSWADPAKRDKILAGSAGKFTEERSLKLKERNREMWNDPVYREKMINATKLRHQNNKLKDD